MQQVFPLFKRYFQQELRNSNALFSLGLYLMGITYLIYLLGGNNTTDSTWNTLLWVVTFFAAVTQSSRSFEFESSDYFYYYQSIAKPGPTIIAKLLFNAAYMLLLSLTTWLLFSFLREQRVQSKRLRSGTEFRKHRV